MPSTSSSTPDSRSAYAAAGVDIDEMTAGLSSIKRLVRATATDGVLSEIGRFGGMFRSPGKSQVLVASTDGVGTKLKVAALAGRHDTVGQCLVNHCVNDILAQGARPLFFLDYLGTAQLDAKTFRAVVRGLCKACRENGCALLGGETAEMPGLYPPGEYDLVGTIVGAAGRREVVTGETLRAGDVLIGLPSSGLQTNGYSLARRILFDKLGLSVHDPYPGSRRSVAQVLLAVHASFLRPVEAVWQAGIRVHGMAHITGGGLVDNVPRMLPGTLDAVIDLASWRIPGTFRMLEEQGGVDRLEMYRVFNMGIGFVLAVRSRDAGPAVEALRTARTSPVTIGRIESGRGVLHLA